MEQLIFASQNRYDYYEGTTPKLNRVYITMIQNLLTISFRSEMNGHEHDFGHEFVSESMSEADSETNTRFFGAPDSDMDSDKVMTSDKRVRSSLPEFLNTDKTSI